MKKLLALLLCLASSAYGIEYLVVDSLTRNIINLGAANFATGQLKVNGIAVVGGAGGGGGGGGTGTIDNITLALPTVLFASPVDFTVSGGLASGTANLATQTDGTVFANISGGTTTPTFVSLAAFKSTLSLDNVNNTSDASKPISTATQAALDTLTGNVTTNTTNIASLTTTVAGKADSSTVTTGLAAKADITYVDTQDATKQNSWGLPAFNGYIAAGDTDGSLHWVDPVTLGTTSQTFTDGVENSTTTLTSATANFVSTDVGKTITGANIPAATTIASVTNSTTVILSAAATATGTGNTFTILNRLEVGGTGTVTSVAAGNLSPLFTSTVTSPSSSATITYSLSNAAANTFFGNGTALSAAPTFMDAGTARTALGGTTVGQSIFSLANPGAIKFIRLNADNTASTRTATEIRTDIGAGTVTSVATQSNLNNALLTASVTTPSTTPIIVLDPGSAPANTFYGNNQGSAAVSVFMSAGQARTNLGGTTVGQNLFQLANPSAITYPRISATNTVTTLTPAQVLTDIGGVATTDTRFPANVTGIRKSGGLASTDTAATANVDYAKNAEGTVGNAPLTWTVGATVMRQSAALTQTRAATLPAANAYAPGTIITYIDSFTTGNFGYQFSPFSGNTLNGSTNAITPFIAGNKGWNGAKSAFFETNGVDAWRLLGAGILDHVEDVADATKQITFDASTQVSGTPGVVTPATGNSVTVIPSDLTNEVVRQINNGGTVIKSQLAPTELLPNTYSVGTAGANIASGTVFTVPTNTLRDTVRIAGNLQGPITIVWPEAGSYSVSNTVTLLDDSGTVSPTNFVTLSSISGNTFNGATTFKVDEQNCRKVLTSNGIAGASGIWTVPLNKAGNKPYTVLTATGAAGAKVFTIIADTSATSHTAQLNLFSGANALAVTNAYDGMQFDLFLVQPASGSAATLTLPVTSAVSGGGAGIISLTATNGAIDRLRGSYAGTLNRFLWDAPNLNYTTAALPSAPSGLTATGANSSTINLSWTDNATNETRFDVYRAPTTTTTFVKIGEKQPNSTSYVDSGLAPNTQYNYTVTACNSAGCSAQATPDDGTTSVGGAQAELWELHLNQTSGTRADHTVGPDGITGYDSWTTSTQNTSNTPHAAYHALAGLAPVTGMTVTPTGGTAGNTYSYRVFAMTNDGRHSLAVNASTTAGPASSLPLTVNNYNTISWTAPTGTTPHHYEVWRTAVPSGSTVPTGRIALGSSFTFTTLDDANSAMATDLPMPGGTSNATDLYNITAESNITYGQVVTLTFWIKSTFSFNDSILSLNNGHGISATTGGGNKLSITERGGNGSPLTATISNTTLNDGNWHFIAVVLDNSTATNTGISATGNHTPNTTTDNIVVYYDGNNPQTCNFTVITRATATSFSPSQAAVGSNACVADIDDVRIYNRRVTPAEIATLFSDGAQ